MPFLKGFSDSPQPKYFDALQRLMKDICNVKFLDSHGCERLPGDIEKKYQTPCTLTLASGAHWQDRAY
jgi:hypothetical protein